MAFLVSRSYEGFLRGGFGGFVTARCRIEWEATSRGD